jgi:peptide deformylase
MNTRAAERRRAGSELASSAAEREQRRQLALRHVRQYPDPVLRRQTERVETFDAELRSLVERMHSIMHDAWGVGLAAPQLGLLLQLFTYQFGEGDEPGVLVNPVVESSSDETAVDDEGCLSLGSVGVPVERAVAITVSGQDLEGESVRMDLEGYQARVFQHEIDHLNGVLMIDKVADPEARGVAMRALRPQP